ncbi:hypothetical protein AVEN_88618-1 [Araneus ventricosus]|uniref:Uncharacterized protein n=1 Tax=Araneus ventricosus TaxID=182803 RepID=A0A4Y2FPB7_ARAVE|nr:hypothetical protein AVEN_88618-1 [Araneus ventricosus]
MANNCWKGGTVRAQFGSPEEAFHSKKKELLLKTGFCGQGFRFQGENRQNNKEAHQHSANDRFCFKDHSKGDSCSSPSEERKGTCVCFCCRKSPVSNRKPTRVIYYEIPRPKFGGESVTERDYKVKPLPKREIPSWHPLRSQPWKRLTVPCQTETTYKMDFQPPPHGRLLPRRAQMARE